MLTFDFHGGSCCGIKHIWGLGVTPEAELGPLEEWDAEKHGNFLTKEEWNPELYDFMEEYYDEITDGCGTPGMRWYYPARPAETYRDRLKAYLEWHDEQREGGVIEIVLAFDDWAPQHAWVPFIEKLGFKLVTLFENSNSGNIVGIFHRTTQRLPLKERPRPNPKPKKAAKAAPFARR